MKKHSCLHWLRHLAMAFVVITGLSLAPVSSAHAQKATIAVDLLPVSISRLWEDTEGFRKVLEFFTEILSVIDKTINMINDGFEEIFGGIGDELQSWLATERVGAEIKMRLTDYTINSNTNDVQLSYILPFVMRHIVSPNAHLCRRSLLHRGGATGQAIVEQVANIITDAYLMGQQGPGQDERGPRGTRLAMELRCINGYGNPVDGYPAVCSDTITRIGPFKRMIIDADILPSSLDGAISLEIPFVDQLEYKYAEGQTMAVTVPNPANNEQKAWLGAMNYCLQLPGPKITMPTGDFAVGASGRRWAREIRTLTARASELVHQCGMIVGYYSRSNSLMKDARAEETTTCNAAIGKAGKTNYFDEQTMKDKFDECKSGLSMYQRQLLEHLACKSTQSFMLAANSGAVTEDMLKDAVSCDVNWNEWQIADIERQGSLVDVARGLLQIRDETAALAMRIYEEKTQGSVSQNGSGSPYIPASEKKMTPKAKQENRQAKPDQAVWPEAVSP